MPKPKRQKQTGRGRVPRFGLVSTRITPYHANATLTLKRRWYLEGVSGTDTLLTRFVVGVTSGALTRSISMITDDVSNPSAYVGIFSAVKVLSVKLYYAAPTIVSTATIAQAFPATQGFTISIEPTASTASQFQFQEITATSRGPDDLVCVSWVPDPMSYPAAGTFQAANSTYSMFNLAAYPGAIVDISFIGVIADGSFNSAGTTTSAATLGNIGYGCLDDSVTAGAGRSWKPVGTNTPLI
jgi:hypothetical protein